MYVHGTVVPSCMSRAFEKIGETPKYYHNLVFFFKYVKLCASHILLQVYSVTKETFNIEHLQFFDP